MKYVKKPVVIEAVQFNGSSTHKAQIEDWMGGGKCPEEGGIHTRDIVDLPIETEEGTMVAKGGSYIIKGVEGEFYPCDPDIFKKTYEKVGNEYYASFEEHF